MAIVRIMLLIGACLIYGVAADDGDDFSNNLFTDLGPLLTLFGERVTMQFMSQSMGWADNVVLAMAPLGILTAVVGAIRVGGPSWLKAIIGRARESRAISEAELMSSTSHEVCELWNGHEIVRVMGKGPIREFVVLEPPAAAADNDDDNNNKGRRSGSGKGGGGREMMKVVQEKEDHGKYLVDDKFTTQSDDPENGNGNGDCSTIIMRNTDVCTPNLTLNVHGHVNRWELYVVAIVGTILQLGVIVYFGFASVTFLHDGSPVAQYALPSTVLGTLLLVVGIMICSYVVKSSTGETRYRPLSGREARVVWLQKSGTVNDQSFDSFAVFPTVPLEVITTSERLPVRFPKSQGGWLEGLVHRSLVIFGAKTRAEAVTVIGSVVSICGYVVQFVGLRGMHWSAAVVQLGATAAMTASRAWVRRSLARLPESQNLVSGFELDWLALTLSMDPSMAPWSRGLRDNGNNRARPWAQGGEWDWEISSLQGKADDLILKRFPCKVVYNGPTDVAIPGNKAHNIMRTRRELGKLAGWHGPASMEAISLARAIEITMDTISGRDMENLSWSLPVHDELIHFRLERSSTGSWKSFGDELEAALSLWLYYIDDAAEEPNQKRRMDDADADADPGKPDFAKGIRPSNIRGNDDAWLRAEGSVGKRNLQLIDVNSLRLRRDLGWWMPGDVDRILRIEKLEPNKGRGTVQAQGFQMDAGEEDFSRSRTVEVEKHRIVGLMTGSVASEIDDDFAFSSEQSEHTILAIESYRPLKTLLAQYMFSSFMWAAAKMLKESQSRGKIILDGVELVQRPYTGALWDILLKNVQLSKLAQDIQSTGIGSLEEVYISIIPPLSRWALFPRIDVVADEFRKLTQPLQKSRRWEEAWERYWWLWKISRDSNIATDAAALVMEHLRIVKAAKELMKDQLYESDTISKLEILISQIVDQLKDDQLRHPDSAALYHKLASLYVTQHRSWDSGLPHVPWELDKADRTLGLHLMHTLTLKQKTQEDIEFDEAATINCMDVLGWTPLHYGVLLRPSATKNPRTMQGLLACGADTNAQDFQGLTPLHLICREEYHGAKIRELLRYGADINIRDINGRAPLHYAAAHGHKLVVQTLMEAGASINLIDGQGHTPLLWAAYKGYPELVDDLWSDEHKKLRDHNGRTPLHLAAIGVTDSEEKEAAKLEVVKKIIDKGVNIEANDRFGQTPLHVAVRSGNKSVTRALLERGANKQALTENGETLLHMAAQGGHVDITQTLLENGADVEAKNLYHYTPLHEAAKAGHEDVVKLLLKAGADKYSTDVNQETPLYYAVEGGYETIVGLLLDPCNDAKTKQLYADLLWTASRKGKCAVVHLLLDRGADICALSWSGGTALHAAIESRLADKVRVDMVQLLLDRGADINARRTIPFRRRAELLKKYPDREIDNYGDTPLLLASIRQCEAVVELLLDRGADKEVEGADGRTPLGNAAREGLQASMLLLLNRGANTEAKDTEGRTPLFYCYEARSNKGVKALIDFGADVNARDTDGTTPLFWVRSNSFVAQQLLDQGADKEAKSNDGETPLFRAVRAKSDNVIKVLLGAGANIEAKDIKGRTPLFRAVEDNLEAMVQLLLKWGANKEARNNDGETPLGLAERKGYENIAYLLRD